MKNFDSALEYINHLDNTTGESWSDDTHALADVMEDYAKMYYNKQLMLAKIPTVGKTYDVFDDGKIRESRRYEVTIDKVVPFSDIDEVTLKQWKEEVKTCHWLYSTETDFFVKVTSTEEGRTFVRTKDGGWFSMGFLSSGRLDIDGTLREYCIRHQND